MTCTPPWTIIAVMRKEKIERIAREQSAVDTFIDEDEDIMDFNERHFGIRTS